MRSNDPAQVTLTMAQAQALIAEAQAWFTRVAISPAKQALWASALTEVRGLRVEDVRAALRTIATAERPAGVFWSLEIAEVLSVAKAEMRRRVEREGRDLSRPAIAAKSAPHPDDEARRLAAKEQACAVIDQLAGKMAVPGHRQNLRRAHGPQPPGEISQTIEEANARRALLERQARELGQEKRR